MPFTRKTFFAAFLGSALTAPLAASAQDTAASEPAGGALALELNSANDTGAGSCRLIFVADNGAETGLDLAAFQIAVFDTAGDFSRLLRLDFPGIGAGRTKVFQFDLPDTECGSIATFLVNDTLECTQSGGTPSELCGIDGMQPSSRTGIAFGYSR